MRPEEEPSRRVAFPYSFLEFCILPLLMFHLVIGQPVFLKPTWSAGGSLKPSQVSGADVSPSNSSRMRAVKGLLPDEIPMMHIEV